MMEKISTAGELDIKSQQLKFMQGNKKWYWYQKQQQQVIIIKAYIILHPCLDVMAVKDFRVFTTKL